MSKLAVSQPRSQDAALVLGHEPEQVRGRLTAPADSYPDIGTTQGRYGVQQLRQPLIPPVPQPASRNGVIRAIPGSPAVSSPDALTRVSNHSRDRPGGRTVAGARPESAPDVKLLTATTRTAGRSISRCSTCQRGRSRAPQTSLPWQATEMP